MRWQNDLLYDIRFHDSRDDSGAVMANNVISPKETFPSTEFSDLDNELLSNYFKKNNPKFILEIGVYRSKELSSTQCIFNNKRKGSYYLGIDIVNKTFLENKNENIYILRTNSSNYNSVHERISELGFDEIDFLLIDGDHSTNQVLKDWEYSGLLSDDGCVAFHDTRHHAGPRHFVKALNPEIWNVEMFYSDGLHRSFGLSFCKKQ